MKILKLTPEIKAEIKEQRDTLAEALNDILKFDQGLQKLVDRSGKLTTEIAKLKTANPDDKAAIHSLGEKRTELELVEGQIEGRPKHNVPDQQILIAHLRQASRLLNRTLLPTYEDYVSKIAALLRPYHTSDAWAKNTANQTQAAKSLAALIAVDFGHGVNYAKAALKRCDDILAGELPWEFNPND